MYKSLQRAVLTAIALSAAVWVLFVAVSRQLVAVPAPSSSSVAIAQTLDPTSHLPAATRRLRSR
jgi:hypothetical protein